MFTQHITSLKVIQHNVLHWPNRRFNLINTYMTESPDLILINSHGLPNHHNLKIPGYICYQQNRSGQPHAGVGIAIKKGLQHKIFDDFNYSDTLSIKLMTNLGPINIATSYIPPRDNCIMFPDYLKIIRMPEPAYIIGDLNARHTSFGHTTTNTTGKNVMRLITDYGVQHLGPNFPTYIGHSALTTPDIILTNGKTYHNTSIKQGKLTTSDHIPIIFTVSTTPILIPAQKRLDIKKANWEAYANKIDTEMPEIDLEGKNTNDIDNALDTWYRVVKKAQSTAIPLTTYKTLPYPAPGPDIVEAQLRFTNILDHAHMHGWSYATYRQCKDLQRILSEKCKAEYSQHWENTVKNLAQKHKEPKEFWQGIKRLQGNPRKIIGHLKKDGQQIEGDYNIASEFRNTWMSVFRITPEDNIHYDHNKEREVENWHNENQHRTTPHQVVDSQRLSPDQHLSRRLELPELRTAINKTKNTAPGKSKIDKKQITMLPEKGIKYLLTIYNAMLSTGYFPKLFKEATITMIHKPGKRDTDPKNYRPISLLEVPGKILERVINLRLRGHLEDNNLYNPYQYGFRSKRSTTSAITLASEKIAISKGMGINCTVIQRDISKAFDKVWTKGLQYKIMKLGIPQISEKLLCNFLEERTAAISINSASSAPFPLMSGVPQGSVLSPTLFITYTADMPAPEGDLCMDIYYADDATQIVVSNGTFQEHDSLVKREATRLNNFEKCWKIKTNIDKFTLIALGRTKPRDMNIEGNLIRHQNKCKILGHTLTSRGMIIHHINDRISKGKIALTALRRFWHFPEHLKLYLVKTMILPILDYSPIPTHMATKTRMLQLQRVQNKALRFATDQRYPYTESTDDQHTRLQVKLISTRLREAAHKIWEKLDNHEDTNYIHIQELDRNTNMENSWFPRSMKSLRQEPPIHHYTN